MKRIFCAAFFFVSVFISFGSLATEAPVRGCNGCSYVQQQQLAHDFNHATGRNYLYIYDLQNETIFLWEVWRETEAFPGQTLVISDRYPPSQEVRDYFEFVSFVHRQTGGSMEISLDELRSSSTSSFSFSYSDDSISIESSPDSDYYYASVSTPGSAYDVVSSPSQQSAVHNYLMNSRGYWIRPFNVIFGAANLGFRIFYSEANLAVALIVRFDDGSTARFQFRHDTNKFEYVPGSARDSSGNVIPDGPGDFAGPSGYREYDFSGPNGDQNLLNFMNRAWTLGIPITGPSNRRRIGCVSGGGSTHCESF